MEQRTWARAEQPAQGELHLHFVFEKKPNLFQIIPSFLTPKVLIPSGMESPSGDSHLPTPAVLAFIFLAWPR